MIGWCEPRVSHGLPRSHFLKLHSLVGRALLPVVFAYSMDGQECPSYDTRDALAEDRAVLSFDLHASTEFCHNAALQLLERTGTGV